jgi:LPXTG-motif cell wall-anchored protein
MKRTILTLFAILALALTGALLAQSSTNGTAPQGTALNDPGQQSNNLNKPENVNPSPANTNGMTTGSKPYSQPTGTAPSSTAADQTPAGTPDSNRGSDSANATGAGTSQQLPRTASDLPLLAFVGLLALSAGLVVRSRRSA